MHLDLVALRCPPPDRPQSITARFSASGGVIGRGRACTLALPDPTQQISRRHVEIRFRHNEFSLKVVSETNGIHINDVFVRPGAAMPLADGDRIVIGDYEFVSRLATGGDASGDVFSILDQLGGGRAASPSPTGWPAPLRKPVTHRRDAAEESLPTGKQPEGRHVQASTYFPPPPTSPLSNADTMSPDEIDRLLRGLPGGKTHAVATESPDLDLRIEPTEVLHPEPLAKPARRAGPHAQLRSREIDGAAELTDVFSVLGAFAPGTSLAQVPDPMVPPAVASHVFSQSGLAPPTRRPALVESTTIEPPRTPAAALREASTDADGAALVRLLAQALGLEPGELDESRPEATIKVAGELLRLSLEGVHRLLEMREQLKAGFGVEDRTTIGKAENNPLKKCESLNEALAYLVDVRQHTNKLYMPPPKAVEDAMWDICAHEMALMAGMRAALLASLKMFSPEIVERRIKKTGALDAVVPGLYKSKLWDRFLAMYNELQREAEDHFDKLLNHEFSKAYGEQSKKLRRKSAKITKSGT